MSWIKTAAIAALLFFAVLSCLAGPKEFGLTQLNQSLADRNLEIKITAELGTDPPETYQVEPSPAGRLARITGGDLRGLMYGLIDAAEQIHASGKLTRIHASPTIALRGVRLPLTDADRFTSDSWRAYIQMLAISRFNRVTVVVDHFPSALDQRHLRSLAQTAADYALDFILGLPPLADTDALPPLFAACPQIRGIEIAAESLPAALRAQHDAGRLISIDLSEITNSAPHGVAVRALVSIPIDAAGTSEIIRRRLAQVDPTTGFKLDVPAADESPASLYRLWGRLAYSLKP